MEEIVFLSAQRLAQAIYERELSATEVMEAHLEQIARHNTALNAIVTLDEAGARHLAAEADGAWERGELWGPLHGVPVTIKDAFETVGLRTTSGYQPLADYVPLVDATVVSRLRAAGAIILGKTNMPELAKDVQSNSPLFGRANNPWNLGRTPGGSSGGSAAAVAAGLSPLDIGSDFGASIRVPAHFCGIFGLKPTEHRVSAAGHIPDLPGRRRMIRHFNVYGPLARSVEDLKLALSLISGPDGRDWEVPPVPLDTPPVRQLRELRFAWTDDFAGIPVTAETRVALKALAQALADQGCRVERSSPPRFDFECAWRVYGELVGAETVTTQPFLQRMAGSLARPFTLRDEPLHDALIRGYRLSAQQYLTALDQRDHFIAEVERFLADWDAWLCPTSSGPAFTHRAPAPNKAGHKLEIDGQTVPYWMGSVAYTSIFSLTGNPVVVLPLAQSREGLPIGVQVVGQRWREMELLDIAAQLIQVTGSFRRPPGY